jgi:MFS transporter, DHA1 family, tetracycline resistance protein
MQKRSPLLIAFLVVAIDLLGFGMVLPLLPRYGERFGHAIPRESIGLVLGALQSVFSLMQFALAPFWGRLSDRIGRRPVLLVGLGGSVVFYTMFGLATMAESLFWLFVARIGQGIAGATIATAQAVIADCTPADERARGMALIGMAFGIGFTVGPLIGFVTAGGDLQGPPSELPGFVAAGISLVGLLLAYTMLPETRRGIVSASDRSEGGTLSDVAGAGAGAESAELQRFRWFDMQQLRWVLTHKPVAVPVLTFFLATLAFAEFESTISRFTKDILSFNDKNNFWIFFYVGLVLTIAQGAVVRRLVGRVGEIIMMIAGLGLMTVGLGGMALAASAPSLVLLLVVLGLTVVGFACLTPSVQALISRRSSGEHQGEILGINQSAASIARIIGPLMGNTFYGAGDDPHQLPYWISAVLMAVALALAVSLWRDQSRTVANPQATP